MWNKTMEMNIEERKNQLKKWNKQKDVHNMLKITQKKTWWKQKKRTENCNYMKKVKV